MKYYKCMSAQKSQSDHLSKADWYNEGEGKRREKDIYICPF